MAFKKCRNGISGVEDVDIYVVRFVWDFHSFLYGFMIYDRGSAIF